MPRRGKRSKQKGQSQTVKRVQGSILVSFTSGGAAVVTFALAPYVGIGNYSPKLTAISSCFQLFHFTRIMIECNPANFVISAAGAAGLGIIGYCGDQILGTEPSTPQGVVELPWRMPYVGNGNTSGTGLTTVVRRSIPRALLNAQNVHWFNTRVSGTPVQDLLYQGELSIWGSTFSASGSCTFIVDYEVEFKDFIGPAFVPRTPTAPFCGQDILDKQLGIAPLDHHCNCDDEKAIVTSCQSSSKQVVVMSDSEST